MVISCYVNIGWFMLKLLFLLILVAARFLMVLHGGSGETVCFESLLRKDGKVDCWKSYFGIKTIMQLNDQEINFISSTSGSKLILNTHCPSTDKLSSDD